MESLASRIDGDLAMGPETDCLNCAWYAIRTKPRFEKLVARVLRGKGYNEFLPVQRVRRPKSDRTIVVEHPLFPGYLFCRFDCTKRLPIISTPGVLYIVSNGQGLTAVPDEEVVSLQRLMQSGLDIQHLPFHAGATVWIDTGPLAGVHGTVIRSKDRSRVIVSVTMLHRSVLVEVTADSLTTQILQ